jgi:glycosyltransferase involved in cell wall biosynthesis
VSQPRRLAFILKSSDLGGTQRYVLELCRRLDHDRWAMEVVTSSGGPLIDELQRMGIPVHLVEIPRYAISAIADWRAMRALTRLFRERRYDIVHPNASKPGVLGRVAARRAGVPITVFTYHLIPFHDRVGALKRFIYRLSDRIMARHFTTHMIAVAHHHRNNLLRHGICAPDDVEVIWNGLDPPDAPPDAEARRAAKVDRLGCDPARPVVAYIARLMPQKDPETYIRSVKAALGRGADAQFLLIGDGALMPECRALAHSLGLTDEKMRFVGERSDVPDLLPGVDLFVLPSLWEGLPFGLLEAMAAHVPIVCSDIPGNDEVIIHDETGLLVPTGKPDALAEAMCALITDPERAQRLARAGWERLRAEFTLDQMVAKTEAVYERLWQKKMANS